MCNDRKLTKADNPYQGRFVQKIHNSASPVNYFPYHPSTVSWDDMGVAG